MESQLTEWEKMFASDLTNKGLISKIYKQLTQFNIKKQIKKVGRRPEQTFFTGDIHMANRHLKNCSTMLIIIEIINIIEIIIGYHQNIYK